MKNGQIICFRQLPSFLHFSTRRKVLEHASHTYSRPSENSLSNGVWKSKKKFSLYFCFACILNNIIFQSSCARYNKKMFERKLRGGSDNICEVSWNITLI